MKYILWKQLKTKAVNEFDSEDIQEVLDYAVLKGYEYTGESYVGGFATFTNGKHTFSVQGQHSTLGIVCSYAKDLIKIKQYSDLAIA